MSFHYTVCVSAGLRRDMEPVDVALLEYLFNAAGPRPEIDAGDELRSGALKMERVRQLRERGSDPYSASMVEISRMPDGALLSARLYLFSPGHKLEGIWENWLFMLQWLATLIVVDGHFATVVCEDGGRAAPDLFYAFDRGLFMNAKREPSRVQSVVSSEERELPAR